MTHSQSQCETNLPWGLELGKKKTFTKEAFPHQGWILKNLVLQFLSQPEWGTGGGRWRPPLKLPLHLLFWDRKCVMEWEEPHDSTLYCLQTDGNHLLATGSSYYGVVRLWDRRQRACLHVSIPPTSCLLEARAYFYGLHLGVGVPGEGGRKPVMAPGPLRWARESWLPAPASPPQATLAIPVTSLAGLPADIDAPQQSCVLPALHHQACGGR